MIIVAKLGGFLLGGGYCFLILMSFKVMGCYWLLLESRCWSSGVCYFAFEGADYIFQGCLPAINRYCCGHFY